MNVPFVRNSYKIPYLELREFGELWEFRELYKIGYWCVETHFNWCHFCCTMDTIIILIQSIIDVIQPVTFISKYIGSLIKSRSVLLKRSKKTAFKSELVE